MTEHPEIPLQNIRAGDMIRTEYTGYDTHVTITGKAYKKDFRENWTTESNMNLTNSLRMPTEKYYLVDRPKPPLPTKPDSAIRITKITDESTLLGSMVINKISVLDTDGDWVIILDGGVEYLKPVHILEWNAVTIIDQKD